MQLYAARRAPSTWRRQQTMGQWGMCPLDFQQFHFSSLQSKSDCQLSKYYVVCQSSLCRCKQLTALSISTALSHKTISHQAAAAEDVQADHSVGSAVAKQRSPTWLRDLLTRHVRLSADRRGRRPAAVTSVHSSAGTQKR